MVIEGYLSISYRPWAWGAARNPNPMRNRKVPGTPLSDPFIHTLQDYSHFHLNAEDTGLFRSTSHDPMENGDWEPEPVSPRDRLDA